MNSGYQSRTREAIGTVFSTLARQGFTVSRDETTGEWHARRTPASIEVVSQREALIVRSTDKQRRWETTFEGVTQLRKDTVIRYVLDTHL